MVDVRSKERCCELPTLHLAAMTEHDEQQPLLPVHDDQRPTDSKPPQGTYRERSALFLDSPSLHKIVITLVSTRSVDSPPAHHQVTLR